MPITEKSYKELKEYWDYQRKVQYNKEMVYRMADQFQHRVYNDFGPVPPEEVKEQLWARVHADDYEEPHKGWIPEDKQLRFEWEGDPKAIKTSDLKGKWKEAFNEE